MFDTSFLIFYKVSSEIFVSPRFSSLNFFLLLKLFGEEFSGDFTTGYGYPSDEESQGEERTHYYKVQSYGA